MIQITVPVSRRPDLNDAYQQYDARAENYVATKVFAPLAVETVRGEIEVVRRDNATQDVPMARAANGTYNRIDQMLEVLKYSLVEKGAEHVILAGEQNTIQYNKLLGGTRLLKLKRWISREIDFSDVLFNAGTVPASALVGAVWTNPASTPLTDLIAARENVRLACGAPPDTIVMSATNLSRLLGNTEVRNCFPGMQVLTMDAIQANLPALCGYSKLFISNGITNTVPVGNFTAGSIVPDDTVAVCMTANADDPAEVMCTGRTLYWAEDAGIDGVVETYISNEQRGMVVRVRDYQNPILFDAATAALLTVA